MEELTAANENTTQVETLKPEDRQTGRERERESDKCIAKVTGRRL